jgi:hypothetical protein
MKISSTNKEQKTIKYSDSCCKGLAHTMQEVNFLANLKKKKLKRKKRKKERKERKTIPKTIKIEVYALPPRHINSLRQHDKDILEEIKNSLFAKTNKNLKVISGLFSQDKETILFGYGSMFAVVMSNFYDNF